MCLHLWSIIFNQVQSIQVQLGSAFISCVFYASLHTHAHIVYAWCVRMSNIHVCCAKFNRHAPRKEQKVCSYEAKIQYIILEIILENIFLSICLSDAIGQLG